LKKIPANKDRETGRNWSQDTTTILMPCVAIVSGQQSGDRVQKIIGDGEARIHWLWRVRRVSFHS
jgi:hypothetical protein